MSLRGGVQTHDGDKGAEGGLQSAPVDPESRMRAVGKRLFRRLRLRSEFNRNVLTMLFGTSIAQAIPIVVSPILTRLYSPEEFGLFALYTALAAVLLIFGTGRYELAIILPKDDEDARGVVMVVSLMSVCVAIGVLGVVAAFSSPLAVILNNRRIRPWLFLLPVSVLATGVYTGLFYYHNRVGHFREMARAQIGQSGSTAATNLSIGGLTNVQGGLILGTLVGQFVSSLYLMLRSPVGLLASRGRGRALRRAAVKYRKFPLVQLPATFLEAVAAQAPTVLLSVFFGPLVVGFFALSQRVVRTPITVVGRAIAAVFLQDAGRQYAERRTASGVFLETVMKLVLLSVVPFGLLFLVAPSLFALVFGHQWRIAGDYARILAPMFWLSFVVSPVSTMLMIAEKQEYDLAIQVSLICSSVAALYVGYRFFGSAERALELFSAVYCAKYCVELALSYRLAANRSASR